MKKSVKRQLRKFRRTNNHGEREKICKIQERAELLLMKNKIEFDQERLIQLKQHFNNPSKFWQTIRSANQKSIIIISSHMSSGTNTSLEFLTRLTHSMEKRMDMTLWRMK